MAHKIDEFGIKWWFNDKNQVHRLDGPAIIYPNGTKRWYQNGLLHRLDGPAVEYFSGTDGHHTKWWIRGEHYTEEGFNKKVKEINEINESLKSLIEKLKDPTINQHKSCPTYSRTIYEYMSDIRDLVVSLLKKTDEKGLVILSNKIHYLNSRWSYNSHPELKDFWTDINKHIIILNQRHT